MKISITVWANGVQLARFDCDNDEQYYIWETVRCFVKTIKTGDVDIRICREVV